MGNEGTHAHRLIDAAQAVSNLKNSPTGELPIFERQVRPLTKLEPEQQREAWKEATKNTPQPTAAKVTKAAFVITKVEPIQARESAFVVTRGETPPPREITVEIEHKTLELETHYHPSFSETDAPVPPEPPAKPNHRAPPAPPKPAFTMLDKLKSIQSQSPTGGGWFVWNGNLIAVATTKESKDKLMAVIKAKKWPAI
jgi:hypothetical protein